MKRKYVIGIDIGGTTTKIGVVECLTNENFLLKKIEIIPTLNGMRNLHFMIETMTNVVDKLKKEYNIHYCGTGVAALVDPFDGVVIDAPNIMWNNLNLKRLLEKQFGIKTVIDNDANLATLAVYFTEVKRKYKYVKNMLCFTLGTGVGGGVIVNGELFHSKHFSSGELGHIVVNPNGEQCGCGNFGCLERYVGARWFIKNVIKEIKQNSYQTLLYEMIGANFDKLTPEILYRAAKKGDKFALKQWQLYGQYLGIAISSLFNILTPEVISFTGGVANAYKFFLPSVKREVKKRVWPKVKLAEGIKYHVAVKQNYGVIGAGIIAYKTFLSK